MIPTMTVNGLTVVHQNSDGVIRSGAPDVCLTPTPAGPVPIPYMNTALSSNLLNGSATVKVNKMPVALKDSFFMPSQGDEPGVLGGVISAVNMGKAKFMNYSMNVMIEGRNVARLSDPMTMNGNDANTIGPAETQGNLEMLGDNKEILCKIFCWCDAGKDPDDFVKKEPAPTSPSNVMA
jgi:uncharacterized Zn-binding protein involved in type VI secretion